MSIESMLIHLEASKVAINPVGHWLTHSPSWIKSLESHLVQIAWLSGSHSRQPFMHPSQRCSASFLRVPSGHLAMQVGP
jgi:hypothetical protein